MGQKTLVSTDSDVTRLFKFSALIALIIFVILTSTYPCVAFPPLQLHQKHTQKAENQKQAFLIAHPADISQRIKEIQGSIKQYENTGKKSLFGQMGISISDINSRSAKLQELKASYQSFLTVLKDQKTLEKTEELTRDNTSKNQLAVSEKPPYSLSFYDQFRDQLTDTQQQKRTAELAKKLAQQALEDAQTHLAEAQTSIRSLKDQVARKKETALLSKLKWDLKTANIDAEHAQVTVNLLSLRLKNIEKQIEISTLIIEQLEQNIQWVRKRLHFDKTDLQNQLDRLDKKRDQLQNSIKKLLTARNRAETLWLQAQNILTQANNQNEMAAANAYLKAKDSWRETYQNISEQTENALQLINQMEDLWKKRYEIIKKNINQQQLKAWEEDSGTNIENLDRTLTLQQSYQTNLQTEVGSIQKSLSTENIPVTIRKYRYDQLRAVEKLTKGSFEYLSILLATKSMNECLIDQIKSKQQEVPLREKISSIGVTAQKIWNFELWIIDGHSVTVKTFIIALIILIGGILLLKTVIRIFTKRLVPKTHLDPSASAALEKIVYYFGITLVVLFALRVVNIPLTAFTFLGGAIAIGVGFGAQNLINNFISGFIIMAERPIKIGDLIDIGGLLCRVDEIGARCTKVRTSGNKNILVPNSSFLEKNITNWTFSDHSIRSKITVGIAYGSSVRDAEQLLMQAVQEHKRVLKDPKPVVIFRDFGESALLFDVYFWVRVYRFMEREKIASDIRFRIDDLFKEAEIVISFPQRDIHMNTLEPIEFKLIDTRDNKEIK